MCKCDGTAKFSRATLNSLRAPSEDKTQARTPWQSLKKVASSALRLVRREQKATPPANSRSPSTPSFEQLTCVRPSGAGPFGHPDAGGSNSCLPHTLPVRETQAPSATFYPSSRHAMRSALPTTSRGGVETHVTRHDDAQMPASLSAWAKACGDDATAAAWIRLDCKRCLDTVRGALRAPHCSREEVRTCVTSPWLLDDLNTQCCGRILGTRERFELVEQYIAVLASALSKGYVRRDDVFGVLFGTGGAAYRVDVEGTGHGSDIKGAGVKTRLMSRLRSIAHRDDKPGRHVVDLQTASVASMLLSSHKNFGLNTSQEISHAAPAVRAFANAVRAVLETCDNRWRAAQCDELETRTGYGEDRMMTMIERLEETVRQDDAQVLVREMLFKALSSVGLMGGKIPTVDIQPEGLNEIMVGFQGLLGARTAHVLATCAPATAPDGDGLEHRHTLPQHKSIGGRIRSVLSRIGQFFKRLFSTSR
jgi:hypothetical protein